MSKHTPEPWNVGWTFFPGGEEIAYGINRDSGTISDEEAVANCAVIEVAPKLVRVVKALLQAYAPHADKTVREEGEEALIPSVREARQILATLEEDKPRTIEQDLADSRAKRIAGGGLRYIVDGHEFADEDSPFMGDGNFPPFVVFDIDRQENRKGTYPTREAAQYVANMLNRRERGDLMRRLTTALKDTVGAADNGEPYTDSETLQEFAALVAEAEEVTGVV